MTEKNIIGAPIQKCDDQHEEIFDVYEYNQESEIGILCADEKPTSITDARDNVHHKLLEIKQANSVFIDKYIKIRNANRLGASENARSAKTQAVQRDDRVVKLLSEAYDRVFNDLIKDFMQMNAEVFGAATFELSIAEKKLIEKTSQLRKRCNTLVSAQSYIHVIYDNQNHFIKEILNLVQDSKLTFGKNILELDEVRQLVCDNATPKIAKEVGLQDRITLIDEMLSNETIQEKRNEVDVFFSSFEVDFQIGMLNIQEISKLWKPTLMQTWHTSAEFFAFVKQSANEMIEQAKELDEIYQAWQNELDTFNAMLDEVNTMLDDEINWQDALIKSIKNRMYSQEEIVYSMNELLDNLGHKTATALGQITENRKLNG